MTSTVLPFSLKDEPALIEYLLPVQKLSAEAYKEQMAGTGKTLTVLGSYWKGLQKCEVKIGSRSLTSVSGRP